MNARTLAALVILLCAALFIAACTENGGEEKRPLKVVLAGSLLLPFEELEASFEASHPDVDVQLEGHGSIQAIRQVTDLSREFDIVAVADESLVPDLMFRPMKDDPSFNYTDWYIGFAGNQMVIAYTEKSRYADEITEENWPEILSRPDVRVGFSNPMLDSAGYRTLMVGMLAGEYYGDPALFDRIFGSHFDPPLETARENTTTMLVLPEIMRPSDNSLVIRDGSIYLLSLLQSGGIDYAFEYKSVSEGMNLSYVPLPPEIDLSDPSFTGHYNSVKVLLGFQRFSTIGRERTGIPIRYAITIPENAPSPDLAEEFVRAAISRSRMGGKGWPSALQDVEYIGERGREIWP